MYIYIEREREREILCTLPRDCYPLLPYIFYLLLAAQPCWDGARELTRWELKCPTSVTTSCMQEGITTNKIN